MFDDIKKSFNSILYERTTSPFFGTLIISWLIWNWKIVYLTFFISEDKINEDKITYIAIKLSNYNQLITYPLISTILLLTVIPFISNGAYWLSLKFDKWKKDQKNIIERSQLLSLEQSIELREQLAKQEKRFDELLENKNLEIKQLKSIIDESKSKLIQNIDASQETPDDTKELAVLASDISKDPGKIKDYDIIIRFIQAGSRLSNVNINSKMVALLEAYDIIANKGNAIYSVTINGKKFHRMIQNNLSNK